MSIKQELRGPLFASRISHTKYKYSQDTYIEVVVSFY